MFKSLLSIVMLMFAVFAVDHLGFTSAITADDTVKTEAEHHTEPIKHQKFTDRIAAKGIQAVILPN